LTTLVALCESGGVLRHAAGGSAAMLEEQDRRAIRVADDVFNNSSGQFVRELRNDAGLLVAGGPDRLAFSSAAKRSENEARQKQRARFRTGEHMLAATTL
jgi:hypothetical protein